MIDPHVWHGGASAWFKYAWRCSLFGSEVFAGAFAAAADGSTA